MLFKDDEVPSRFEIAAIIRGLAPGTGFSGFSIRGRVSATGDGYRIRESGQTNHYNVWKWRDEFLV